MTPFWQLRTKRLSFSRRPLVMGIVNVTPDSFSDGGKFFNSQAAVSQALKLEDEGADLLDIGAESTRPYSDPVAAEEELRRLEPVLRELESRTSLPISIDTTKSAVAKMALDFGAEIINDISGLEADPAMTPLAAKSQAAVCIMHMQGTPQTMQNDPRYENVTREVGEYLRSRAAVLLAAGIERERICLDPGIGFGKTHQHNLALLAECAALHELGYPLLVGPSRKGFIAHVLQDKQADRTAGTIGVCLALARQGVQIVRVHDVAAVKQALLLFEASGAL